MTVNIGDLLSQVEDGWKRIDDNNENIIYTGNRWKTTSNVTNSNNNSQHYTGVWGSSDAGEKGEKISFYFYGSKMILYSFMYSTSISNDISVIIDEKVQKTTQEKSNASSYLSRAFYKIENLSKKYHKIEIVNNTNMQMFFDCIDIDSTGNIISQEEYIKYLNCYIKMNNKYYSFSSNNYNTQTKMYNEITLDDINNGLYSDESILSFTEEITIGDETFKPIDKFDNFSIVSKNNKSRIISGTKSKSALIVPKTNIPVKILADNIHNITLLNSINNNSYIKIAISFDNGATWKTYKNNSFENLSIDIPNKDYINMNNEEKIICNNAKTIILTDGFSISDLTNINFNNIKEFKTIKFAYVLYQDKTEDNCKIINLSWNIDKKGSMQKMTDNETTIYFCNNIITVIPLIDCDKIVTTYQY